VAAALAGARLTAHPKCSVGNSQDKLSPMSDTAAEAARVALTMGSTVVDVVSFMGDLGEELPVIKPVLKTLKVIREKVETVKKNREDLGSLEVRCTYLTACVIVKCRQQPSLGMDVTPLVDCVEDARKFVERCGSRRHQVSNFMKASSDKGEIAGLNARVDRLTGDLGLAGIAVLNGKVDVMKAMLERISKNLDIVMTSVPKPPPKVATVPKGTPAQKSWHVERRQVMGAVLEALTGGGGPRLAGLSGASGSGKTTAAAEFVRSPQALETFADGIVWLSVNQGAKERLPSLMLQLARMVHEDIGGIMGRCLVAADDGAAYIKERMENGHGGKGLKCLVVADNVWDKEVVSKLLETGMSVLLSTRDEGLILGSSGKAVGVDYLSKTDAESVLRRTAELPPAVRLPDHAVDLIELCGRVAMDLAFVGRWSTVRGRHDQAAWSHAARKIREEIDKVCGDSFSGNVGDSSKKRREAVLSAGFQDLAIGSDDERVPRLYLSLAVLPDGHAFTVKDAAVLLYDEMPSLEDETSVCVVVDVLERWSVVSLVEGKFHMHDAHSSFAREGLMDRGDVRRRAVKQWVKYISSLEALRAIDAYDLKSLWLAVERVGGDGWWKTRPYVKALGAMDESDPSLCRKTIEAVGDFQEVQKDWAGANATWRLLLEAEKRDLGLDHPFVLNTYEFLADCADRLGNTVEAAQWREKELKGIPLALAKVNVQGVSDLAARPDGSEDPLRSLAGTILRVKPDDRDEAERLLRRCLAIKESKLGPEDVAVAHTLYELGVCALEAGRLEEAEELLRRCLAIRESKLGPEDVAVARTLYQLGFCALEAGRLEEAEELLRRCLAIEESKLGPEDVAVAHTLYELCVCALQAGRLEEAEELLRRSLAIKESKLGPEDVAVANTLDWLGSRARKARRLEEAEELWRRCLAIRESKLGPEDVAVARTLYQLGFCAIEAGRLEEAEELLRRSLAIKESKLGPEDVAVANTLDWLGSRARKARRLEEAEELWRRCLAIRESKLGPEDVAVAGTLDWLGLCAIEAGRLEEA
ncbi:unnamed protein product, partial [Pylaiella littoralis]